MQLLERFANMLSSFDAVRSMLRREGRQPALLDGVVWSDLWCGSLLGKVHSPVASLGCPFSCMSTQHMAETL